MQIEIDAVPYVKDGHKMIRITSVANIMNPLPTGRIEHVLTEGLWDTGATNTYIPMDTAVKLGIELGGPVPVRMGVSSGKGTRFCRFFLGFQNGAVIPIEEGIAVPGMKTGLIIGMDVIGKGVTTIEPDGQDGVRFTFTL